MNVKIQENLKGIVPVAIALAVAVIPLGASKKHDSISIVRPDAQRHAIYFGAGSVAGNGAVPLDSILLNPGSAPIDHYVITQTKGFASTGYFKVNGARTPGGVPADITITDRPITVYNNGALIRATISPDGTRNGSSFITNKTGLGYAPGDTLALNNGACVTLAPGSVSSGGILNNFSLSSQPTSKVTGVGNVVEIGAGLSNGNCKEAATGRGAKFTFTYTQQALGVALNSTGATAEMGGNTTVNDYAEFSFTAFAAAGTSESGVLTLNKVRCAANISLPGSYTGNTLVRSAAGLGIQNFANSCEAAGGLVSTAGEAKILISTGSVLASTNVGPNFDRAKSVTLQDINWGVALQNTTTPLAPTMTVPFSRQGNDLAVMDAARAGGSATAVGFLSNPTAQYTTLDNIQLNGTPSACSGVTTTSGLSYVRTLGLTYGGSPAWNDNGNSAAWKQNKGCFVADDWGVGEYATTFDPSNGFMLSNAVGFVFHNVFLPGSGGGSHVYIRYATCITVSGCVVDGATSLGNATADAHVDHVWLHDYTANGFEQDSSSVAWNDLISEGPYLVQGSSNHNDNWQYTAGNNANPGPVLTRIAMYLGDGNAFTQGFWWDRGLSFAQYGGSVVEAIITGNTATCHKRQASDASLATVNLTYHTCIAQNPQFPGTNTGAPNLFFQASDDTNPADGYTITLGAPAVVQPPYNNGSKASPPPCATGFDIDTSGSSCAPPYAWTITFRDPAIDPTCATEPLKVCLGVDMQATIVNLAAKMGRSLDGQNCPATMTPTARIVLQCANSPNSGGFHLTFISYFPGRSLVTYSMSPSGRATSGYPKFTQTKPINNALLSYPIVTPPQMGFYNVFDPKFYGTTAGGATHYAVGANTINYDGNYTQGAFADTGSSGTSHSSCTLADLNSHLPAGYWKISSDNAFGMNDAACPSRGNGTISVTGTSATITVAAGTINVGDALYTNTLGWLYPSTLITAGPGGCTIGCRSGAYTINRAPIFNFTSQNGRWGANNLYGLFNGDSINNTAEIQLETPTWATYHKMGALDFCRAMVGILTPTAGGGLTTAAGFSKTIGALGTSGNWHDGTPPCEHLTNHHRAWDP